jgi:hypothetical protein
MNKTMSLHPCLALLIGMTVIVLLGCGEALPTITSTPLQPTAMPTVITQSPQTPPTVVLSYLHYEPSKRHTIHLEFDYPDSWLFAEQTYGENLVVISLTDPRFRTLPTPSPEDFHSALHEFGEITILVESLPPGQTLNTEVETRKQIYRETWWATFLSDYLITLDGYDARVLEYQVQIPETHSSVMFERRIYFVIENQRYQIIFSVAEKDRGGEFEQGYERFFNSIDIVP